MPDPAVPDPAVAESAMAESGASGATVVAFYDLGGSGPPLLLAHATGFHGRVWGPLVEGLADRFRCASFDQRGHGDTPAPADGDFDWRGLADDALAVVDAAGLDRPFGFGHSAGATALLLAEAARPGTFRALYCYEPVVFPPGAGLGARAETRGGHASPAQALAAAARRRREVFHSRQEAYEHYAGKPPFSSLHPGALRAYVDHGFDDLDDGRVRLKCRAEGEARTYEMGAAHDAWDRMTGITCPVTVACGALSDGFGPALATLQASRLAAGGTEVFARLGHFGPLQDPPAVADSVRRALLPLS